MSFIGRFFLLVLILSFGELYLLILVAERLSLPMTLLLCVITGVWGGAMVRRQGLRTLKEIQDSLARGRLPAQEIGSGLVLLMTGTMLLTPGFITDTVGFLLLIPPLRQQAVRAVFHYFKKRVRFRTGGIHVEMDGETRRRPTVIEVEAEEVETTDPKS